MSSLIESIKSRAYKLEFDDIGFCKANDIFTKGRMQHE